MRVGWFGIPWYVYALICLLVAIGYSIYPIQPVKGYDWSAQPTWRFIVLRWSHSLVWIFLCAGCLLMHIRGEQALNWAKSVSLLALMLYLIYLMCFLLEMSK